MILHIGSTNKVKVAALAEIAKEYPLIATADVQAVDVPSGVSGQPKTLDETIQGAMNRAKNAFVGATYSFGLESGLMAVPHTKSGFMDVCVCAIFDGSEFHIGLSSAWEAPAEVMKHMMEEGLDMTQASVKAGLTDNPNVGAAEGLVGIMTGGRLNRKEYTKEAIRTALIHLGK